MKLTRNMKLIRIAATLSILTSLAFTARGQEMSTVELQKGEKWWGLYVSASPAQPLDTPFQLTTMQASGGAYTSSVMLSSTGRYVYSDHPFTVSFDGETYTITSEYEKVEARKGGRNLREAYLVCCHNHFAADHATPPVEMFTLPHYETEFDPGCFSSQDEIVAYAERLLAEGFPAGVLVISDGWDQPNTLFDFSHSLFPDPGAMTARLHELGFRVMLSVTPYVSPYGRYYLDGVAEGRFVMGRSGRPILVPVNGGTAVCHDFSNGPLAEAARANLARLRSEYGVDGFRFECTGLLAAMGKDSPRAVEFLRSWMDLAPAEGLNEFLPSTGARFAPYVTGIAMDTEGDRISSAVTALVSAGLTGYPYSTLVNLLPDGGQVPEGDGPLAEYLLFESVMPVPRVRYAPWRIGDATLYAAVKDALNFRVSIAEYVSELVDESAKMAVPLLRNLEYVFPRSGFADCPDQFMLGSHYLFAPVKAGETRRMVRLPKGTWTDREGHRFRGPVVTEVDCSDGRIVCFILNTK